MAVKGQIRKLLGTIENHQMSSHVKNERCMPPFTNPETTPDLGSFSWFGLKSAESVNKRMCHSKDGTSYDGREAAVYCSATGHGIFDAEIRPITNQNHEKKPSGSSFFLFFSGRRKMQRVLCILLKWANLEVSDDAQQFCNWNYAFNFWMVKRLITQN